MKPELPGQPCGPPQACLLIPPLPASAHTLNSLDSPSTMPTLVPHLSPLPGALLQGSVAQCQRLWKPVHPTAPRAPDVSLLKHALHGTAAVYHGPAKCPESPRAS